MTKRQKKERRKKEIAKMKISLRRKNKYGRRKARRGGKIIMGIGTNPSRTYGVKFAPYRKIFLFSDLN